MSSTVPIAEIAEHTKHKVKIHNKIIKRRVKRWFDDLINSLVNDRTTWMNSNERIKSSIAGNCERRVFYILIYQKIWGMNIH